MKKLVIVLGLVMIVFFQSAVGQQRTNQSPFRQLTEELPSPNSYRTASGKSGPDYFQQQVDYDMNVALDEVGKTISGTATITYHNNSPEPLDYLFLQLDQNVWEKNSFKNQVSTGEIPKKLGVKFLKQLTNDFDGGFKIAYVRDTNGHDLPSHTNHTIMKVSLPKALAPGKMYKLKIKWSYNLNNLKEIWGRSGYDPLSQNDNTYAIAQFYPRLCVFNDLGWQTKQFMDAEFALEFGNFNVNITVPADHIVAATGELQNSRQVLSQKMLKRLGKAKTSDTPVFIVTEDESVENGKGRSSDSKTWHYSAKNVRDFAFASSRRFMWDAMGVQFPKHRVLAMSFYPKEGNPLWSQYATKTIAHTLKTYSEFTFDYPYPTASAVNVKRVGMEYPMLGFVDGRPNSDGTYSKAMKRWVIGTVIHEVGHNYFPMIVNSDERQWAWMDEGFNIFLQGIAERRWDTGQNWSGAPIEMKGYMDGDPNNMSPLMTSADDLLQPGMESYRKPAVALNILRETILGRELFLQSFQEYAHSWMFKHPQPADFFRVMEDASGIDLDWFWRGWFFTTDYVDLSIDDVTIFEPIFNVEQAEKAASAKQAEKPVNISDIRNKGKVVSLIEQDPSLKDDYDLEHPILDNVEVGQIEEVRKKLTKEELVLLEKGQKFYEVTFSSKGGMLMPLIIQFEFIDGSKELQRIPVQIWIKNQEKVTKLFQFDKELKSIALDPYYETADMDMENNNWPRKMERVFLQVQKK
ncbi:M1 family metallopeptidase [Flavobacteriaceae bacterium F89]|uniref:M1 family metallopeptidase n=1 Tax=Cerina litoralis TaxID=2874477 RepID=A0AAE3JSB1_9FLAO|nr:M1 family metallopeptidase [Cerina litoralis]MCG2462283.1 M1 family metallopeptidase [Cerina litoralis]